MDKKFVILNIHPNDALYDKRDKFLGLSIVPSPSWHKSFVDNNEDGKYMAGEATLEKRLEILGNGNWVYFYAVIVAPLSEIENS